MKRVLVAFVIAVSVACGSTGGIKIPDITIVLPPEPKPEPKPEPPVVVVPPVVIPEPEPLPFQNLNVVVFDATTGIGINGATCNANNDTRRTDGNGFVNYGVQGPVSFVCEAPDYQLAAVLALSPGDRRFPMTPIEKPKPAGPVACGNKLNTGYISFECLDAVARTSQEWPLCAKGNGEACSLYVWEVARALADTQKDPRWGVITKRSGSNFRGYGEDVVAYLPSQFSIDDKEVWQWNGADIIGGLGGPTPTKNPGKLHGAIACNTPEADAERWCNRSDNYWSPVPRQ